MPTTNIGACRSDSEIGLPVDAITPLGEIVVEEELTEILGMHPIGHTGRVRIPRHQIAERLPLSDQIVADHP